MALTPQQIEQYRTHGYLIFPELFTPAELQTLFDRLEDYVEERRPAPQGVAFQIEPVVQKGEATAASKMDSFRKVENLVLRDDVYQDYARTPKLLEIITSLIGPDVKLFRDALMMKPPRHGSAKPYHQDSAYWAIQPPDLVSVWMAMDDATLENGCMRVLPGSHTWGVLEHKHLEDFQVEEEKLDLTNEVAVPLKAGGCLVFHSLLLHATSPNESDQFRRAMITSYMSAKSKHVGGSPPDYLTICGESYAGCV